MPTNKINPIYMYLAAIIGTIFVLGFGLAELIQTFAVNDISLVQLP